MPHQHPLPPIHPTDRLVGTCPAIEALRAQIRHLAAFDTLGNPAVPTVLLQGETGTGKGLVARVLHDSGPRIGPESASPALSHAALWHYPPERRGAG